MREYWLVSPEERLIESFVLRDDHYQRQGVYDEEDTLTSAVLPPLTLAISQIFPKTI